MRNVQTRVIDAPAHVVDALLDTLATPGDRIWPSPAWWPLRLDGPLAPGSSGGHGPVRYTVTAREPGLVRFAFRPVRLEGEHEYTVTPDGPERCVLTHTLTGRAIGSGRVTWPLMIRWCHEALIQASLDNAEHAATGRLARPHRMSPWVRLCRYLLRDKPVATAIPERAALAHGAFPRPDYTDSFSIRLRPGMPEDPAAWASAIFFHRPFPTFAAADGEVLIGDTSPVDFRVSVLVDGERLHMSTLVRLRGPWERLYFRFVTLFHRAFVKAMLRRAVARACVAPVRPDAPARGMMVR
ncbi:DUF2867 domain-containing protein [Phytomonospora endophytica]|uniref:DUF2867 domain-containing protein n=1 Tax=Phytomonospora endophytica TaxID=714109 RepID=A0A841FFJ8_9ACTN|nr:DUF2867 domain-containing protein [Phytomonospora endophytica]MBB6034624.1 hypothetical protein [Phytomonospora endophytica]GIG71316.1 hypothetical protein Pen01_76110 [Phytomonospora endophytica]